MMRFTKLFVCGLSVLAVAPILIANGAPQRDPAPNAAVIYWQSFALMPNLTNQEDAALKAAISEKENPVPKEIKVLLAEFNPTLRELHRAAQVAPCDWQLDMQAGPDLVMPHLQKARDLGSIALLRARIRFSEGKTDLAIQDTLATFKLARDCGVSPLIIANMLGTTIEKSATSLLAANLDKPSATQCSNILKRLGELPKENGLAFAISGEGAALCTWLRKDMGGPSPGPQQILGALRESPKLALSLAKFTKADFVRSMDMLAADFQTLAEIAALPSNERVEKMAEFDQALEEALKLDKPDDAYRFMSFQFLPKMGPLLKRSTQNEQALLQLLEKLQQKADSN